MSDYDLGWFYIPVRKSFGKGVMLRRFFFLRLHKVDLEGWGLRDSSCGLSCSWSNVRSCKSWT